MNEYELLGGLHEIIDVNVNENIKKWIVDHNTNYCLLYPLAMVELGAMTERPETINNLFRRCISAFIYSKAVEFKKDIYIKKFNVPGFKKFIKEYMKFLAKHENIDSLFEKDSRYCHNETMPRLLYLAVDKRNQMHIGDRHMISEYMLLYLLKKNIMNKEFNIDSFWSEIETLETKVEHRVVSSDFYKIPVKYNMIYVEKNDLCWKQ